MKCTTPPSPATILAKVREPHDSHHTDASHGHTHTSRSSLTINTANTTARPSTPIGERVLSNHPLTLYAISRITNWCVEKQFAPTAVSNTMLDILPDESTDVAIRKLRNRCSYMAKAPYQRKTKKRAFHDKALKLSPATWLGPTVIKAHDRYQYKKDRKHTQKVYHDYQERRENSESTIAVKDWDTDTHPAVVDWPLVNDEGFQIDPWLLPPIESDDFSDIGTADGGSYDFPIPPPLRTPSPLRARTYLLDPAG